ncbi:M15 family metallopeptidase [Cellulomonas sp. NPDC089187]|uniref:M15 family metallopeptidase n=1 Tax=Cellulomonas sp. NPDC089187 TaxID=3154970 RepID=UPI003419A105
MRARTLVSAALLGLLLSPAMAAPAMAGPWPDPRPQGDRLAEVLRPGPLMIDEDPASLGAVVNKQRPLPLDYVPAGLVPVDGGVIELRQEAADALASLRAAAAAEGVTPTLISGYRSAERQAEVYASWVSQMGGPSADEVSARPGHSEHQTGLAVDLGSATQPQCDLEQCYTQTVEGQWLAQNAERFGFVIRYTDQNQDRTGYRPEGWHLRYLGEDLIRQLQVRGAQSVEELFGLPGGAEYT